MSNERINSIICKMHEENMTLLPDASLWPESPCTPPLVAPPPSWPLHSLCSSYPTPWARCALSHQKLCTHCCLHLESASFKSLHGCLLLALQFQLRSQPWRRSLPPMIYRYISNVVPAPFPSEPLLQSDNTLVICLLANKLYLSRFHGRFRRQWHFPWSSAFGTGI